MEETFSTRLKHAWNAFRNRDPTANPYEESSFTRPDRARFSGGNERSIVTSVYNRIALDVANINIKHCKTDQNGRFVSEINSGLNSCLNLEANVDQTGRAFLQDIVMSMLDEGCVAVVPTKTDLDPRVTSSYDISAMRTGKIVQWYPSKVKVNVYDEDTGRRADIILPKNRIAIIENPLYAVMNEPNSTMKRLARKLALLDITDEDTASGKLDLIIQLPYVVKSEGRKKQAEERRHDVEMQLAGSKYGVAYTDGTEKITQLNRSVENNLMAQVEYLTNQLYAQLGITQEVLNGTANEQTLLNYYTRTTEPIISAIVDELTRKFLTKTARTQMQRLAYFRDPFKLIPINNIADIADKFTRNEILTSNEIRQIIGMRPATDPNADRLQNSNINYGNSTDTEGAPLVEGEGTSDDIIDNLLSNLESNIDDIIGQYGGESGNEE